MTVPGSVEQSITDTASYLKSNPGHAVVLEAFADGISACAVMNKYLI